MDTKKKDVKDKKEKEKVKSKDKKDKSKSSSTSSKDREKVVKIMQKEYDTWVEDADETANIGTSIFLLLIVIQAIFLQSFLFLIFLLFFQNRLSGLYSFHFTTLS